MENLLNRCSQLTVTDKQSIISSVQSLEELIVLLSDPSKFQQVSKVDPKVAPVLQNIILSTYAAPVWNLSILQSNQSTSLLIFSSGCSSLDRLLSGGFFAGEITEFVGPSSCGKSQICMSLAATTTAYTEGRVLYIDSNASFSSRRIKEMYNEWIKEKPTLRDLQSALSAITVCSIQDIYVLTSTLNTIYAQLQEQSSQLSHSLRVIIIDSMAALLSPVLGAASTPVDRYPSRGHALMSSISHLLYRIAIEYQIAIVVTNYTVGAVNKDENIRVVERDYENENERDGLGDTWSYVAGVRVRMKLINALPNNQTIDTNNISSTITQIDHNDKENALALAQGGGGRQAEATAIQCSITKSNKAVSTYNPFEGREATHVCGI